MKILSSLGILFFLLILLSLFSHKVFADIHWEKCRSEKRRDDIDVYCGVFSIDSVKLPLIALDSKKRNRPQLLPQNRQAVLYIGGGPGVGGQTQGHRFDAWLNYFSSERRDFDLLFYEQRGTPGAAPELLCDNFISLEKERLAMALDTEADALRLQNNVSACMQHVLSVHKDLKGFSKKNHIQDLAAIVEALPYSEIYLLAESWGAWLSVQIKHEKIKAVILDSPLLPGMMQSRDLDFLHTLRWQSYQKFDPGFTEKYKRAEHVLQKMNLRYSDLVLTPSRFRDLAYFALYSESLRQEFIRALDYWSGKEKGAESAWSSLQYLLDRYQASYLDRSFSIPVWLLASCDLPIKDSSSEDPYLVYASNYHPCRITGFAGDSKNKQVADRPSLEFTQLKYPTLIFAGVEDPVIPLAILEDRLKGKENAILLKIPQAGHGILLNDYCDSGIILDFIFHDKVNTQTYCTFK